MFPIRREVPGRKLERTSVERRWRLDRGVDRVWLCCLLVQLVMLLLSGCAAVFDPRAAREVSRERLLELADAGRADHMKYQGSDRAWHYVFDDRPDRRQAYKVRAEDMELENTFDVGEDAYVLHPWLIEGKRLGKKPE